MEANLGRADDPSWDSGCPLFFPPHPSLLVTRFFFFLETSTWILPSALTCPYFLLSYFCKVHTLLYFAIKRAQWSCKVDSIISPGPLCFIQLSTHIRWINYGESAFLFVILFLFALLNAELGNALWGLFWQCGASNSHMHAALIGQRKNLHSDIFQTVGSVSLWWNIVVWVSYSSSHPDATDQVRQSAIGVNM